MGFDKQIYTCETCGHIFMGERGFVINCNKEICPKKKNEKKGNNILIPKKDIRVNGC